MAKQVIWSPLAKKKRKEIHEFWIEHNQSNTYSLKLNKLFEEAEQLISKYPHITQLVTNHWAYILFEIDSYMVYICTKHNVLCQDKASLLRNPMMNG